VWRRTTWTIPDPIKHQLVSGDARSPAVIQSAEKWLGAVPEHPSKRAGGDGRKRVRTSRYRGQIREVTNRNAMISLMLDLALNVFLSEP